MLTFTPNEVPIEVREAVYSQGLCTDDLLNMDGRELFQAYCDSKGCPVEANELWDLVHELKDDKFFS